jgi:ATP synthase protein I
VLKIPLRDAGAISIGIELVVSVVLGMSAGLWLDHRFHTSPVISLIGIILGSAAGFRSLLKFMRRSQARAEREDAQEQAQRALDQQASAVARGALVDELSPQDSLDQDSDQPTDSAPSSSNGIV